MLQLPENHMTYCPIGGRNTSALSEQVQLLQEADKTVIVLAFDDLKGEWSLYSNIESDDAAESVYFAGKIHLEKWMDHRMETKAWIKDKREGEIA